MNIVEKRIIKEVFESFSNPPWLLARAGEVVRVVATGPELIRVRNDRGTEFFVSADNLEDL